MKYTVYFEIFGKKLKTTVEAENESQAKQAVARKIKFHKIELIPEAVSGSEVVDFLMGFKTK